MIGLVEIFLIAVSLALDAFAVSVSSGISIPGFGPRQAVKMGLWFGTFQFLMPLLGWLLGSSVSQFIIEAGTTSAIGGVIGIILGVVLANVFTALVGVVMAGAEGFSAVPSAGGIAVSFGVSVGIGILFGYLPANKAAKLNPIDALRYD